MNLKIESSNITLTILNDATGQKMIRTFKKNLTIGNVIDLLYTENFLARPSSYFFWKCKCNNIVLGLSDTLKSKLNSGDTLLFCCEEYDLCEIMRNNCY